MNIITAKLKRIPFIVFKWVFVLSLFAVLVVTGFVSGWKSLSPRQDRVEIAARGRVQSPLPAERHRPKQRALQATVEDARAGIRFGDHLVLGEAKAFAVIEALSLSQLPAAFAEAVAQPRTSSGDRLIDIILNRWARLDPAAAVAACAETFHSERERFLQRARMPLYYLARKDPAAAFAAWQAHWASLDEGYDDSTEFELGNVFQAWAKQDSDAAFDAYSSTSLGEAANYAIRGIISGTPSGQRDAMLGRLEKAGDVAMLAEARKTIVSRMARAGSVEDAIAWLDSLEIDPNARAPLEEELAEKWFHSDQEAAAAWLLEHSDDTNRPNRLKELARDWADWEPNAAGEWLGLMVEQHGAEADPAIAMFAQSIAEKDPGAALEWLGIISDAGERRQAAERLGKDWARRHPERPLNEILTHSSLSEADREILRSAAGKKD